MSQTVDWDASISPSFRDDNFRSPVVLHQEQGVAVMRIFHDEFDAFAIELAAEKTWHRPIDGRPIAMYVWSGEGQLNGQQIGATLENRRELMLSPNWALSISASSRLIAYCFLPMNG